MERIRAKGRKGARYSLWKNHEDLTEYQQVMLAWIAATLVQGRGVDAGRREAAAGAHGEGARERRGAVGAVVGVDVALPAPDHCQRRGPLAMSPSTQPPAESGKC
ncbi:hypothetical protein GCM10027062_25520 [Nocardioides hungaricus]